MTTALDPTRICFNDLLLSEFVGNHSVYNFGYANPVQTDVWGTHSTVYDGWARLAAMLTGMRHRIAVSNELPDSMFSISYGWIHPKLSEKIVKWKDPTVPSYHRWDDGAACDINFHHTTFGPYYYAPDLDTGQSDWTALSPLGIATMVNCPHGRFPHLDRTITYSESPYICLGVSPNRRGGRGKWYENRFNGTCNEKPTFITHCNGSLGSNRADDWRPPPLDGDWRGCGHPTYHGGGIKQFHHIRTSLYTMLSDWLYLRDKVHFGHANRMPTSVMRYEYIKNMMHHAGRAYDVLQALAAVHLPIIEGINLEGRTSNWEAESQWSFTISPSGTARDSLYQQIRDFVLPQQGEMLRITNVEQLPDRRYLSASGRELTASQVRIKVTGEYDGPTEFQPGNRFDFTSAATSPAFREGEAGGSNDSVPDSTGVSSPAPRTRRRRGTATSRRRVRTRTFRRRDQD